jgi:hypothetical protein
MEYPSLPLVRNFGLKSILSDIKISTLGCFLIPFTCEYLLSFCPTVVSALDGFFGGSMKMDHVSLYPFIGKLKPLTLRVVIEQCLLILVLLSWCCFLRPCAFLGGFDCPFVLKHSFCYPLQSWFTECKCLKSVFIVKSFSFSVNYSSWFC